MLENNKNHKIRDFIEKVKSESSYQKFLKRDIIYELIDAFKFEFNKIDYPKNIENPLEISLQFYKDYSKKYYEIIMDGIKNKRILFNNEDKERSFVDTERNIAYIKTYGNDSDLFIIVHEFAHYIDRNSKPQIIPDEYWFLSETFALYLEKKLEMWLNYEKYKDLIMARKNNRLFHESRMLATIEDELFYETLYKKEGSIKESDIDLKKVKLINKYNLTNLVNCLLQYPLANIVSDYLVNVNFNIDKEDFCQKCFQIDLYSFLHEWSNNITEFLRKKIT